MKERAARRVLHVDLDPFFVSVERSLDPALRGRPVVVGGGQGPVGLVAAASAEARAKGVRAGMSLAEAQRLCPEAVVRPGDLEAYARMSDEVTHILLSASRRVERPSTDEAYVDLTPDHGSTTSPVAAVEVVKDELQRRLGLDASLGLASSRLAARVASAFGRPRGFVVVLPGYEKLFLAGKPVSFLEDLPPHLEAALERLQIHTLGELAAADGERLTSAVGPVAARLLQAAARGEDEEPVAVAAPPAWIQEQAQVRDRRSDKEALLSVIDGLVARACRRLRPFGLGAQAVVVEASRREGTARQSDVLAAPVTDEGQLSRVARELSLGLIDPAVGVRSLAVRLSRLEVPGHQRMLFPEAGGSRRSSL
jgi:DNA polymerase-4